MKRYGSMQAAMKERNVFIKMDQKVDFYLQQIILKNIIQT